LNPRLAETSIISYKIILAAIDPMILMSERQK